MASLVVLDGSTFVVSDAAGDSDAVAEPSGFFFRDVRHLSRWRLTINGVEPRVLTSQAVHYYAGRVFAALPGTRDADAEVTVQRDRLVADGVHEDIFVTNCGQRPIDVQIELAFATDFADIFELGGMAASADRAVSVVVQGKQVVLTYEDGQVRRGTRLSFSTQPDDLNGERARFSFTLAPRQEQVVCVDVLWEVDGIEYGPRTGHGGFGQLEPQMEESLEEWMSDAPAIDTKVDDLRHSYHRSQLDLAALRFRPLAAVHCSLPAAGLPWYMALFGRDSLITAYEALPFYPQLATGALEVLASLQATRRDDFRDADPGKIIHELRFGILTASGEFPHSPYYGSHDATPLFLVLLDEYERWTGDVELVKRLEPVARAALGWIEGPGDPDGDGYLEYQTRSPKGLANQGWKDSPDAIAFGDGRLAELPIATCELQGYAYDARVRTARLARTVWDDAALSDRLEADALALKQRFDRDFWIDGPNYYALALDADKRHVDSLTSNIGHLLWSGIVDERRSAAVAAHLVGRDLWSGWGVRTMAPNAAGYNPVGYHTGTVWPHDSAICAEGLRRYGYRTEAAALAIALLEAAAHFGHRLPEAFAGFARADTTIPVEFPTPCSPQAWAAGATMLALRTLVGLDPAGEHLKAQHPDERAVRVGLQRVHYRGHRLDVA